MQIVLTPVIQNTQINRNVAMLGNESIIINLKNIVLDMARLSVSD